MHFGTPIYPTESDLADFASGDRSRAKAALKGMTAQVEEQLIEMFDEQRTKVEVMEPTEAAA